MLLRLSISNIAVIESAEIAFSDGLNILSGETGAGKSIIIDSVNLILGQRADRSLIRTGADSAYVEALFDISDCEKTRDALADMFGDADTELVISRELSSSGRNTCRINGRMATLSQLESLTRDLIDIHGQHDHQSLLNPNNHIAVLDTFGGDGLKGLISEYKNILKEYNLVSEKIKSLETDDLEKQRRLEILGFQYKEIDDLNLQFGEDEELRSQRDILMHAEKIKDAVKTSDAMFAGADMEEGIVARLARASRNMQSISDISENYSELAQRLETLIIETEDIAGELQSLKLASDYTEGDLDAVEQRLSDINKLKRKYGSTVEEILEYRDDVKKQMNELEENEFVIGDLVKKKESLYSKLSNVANTITDKRRENGERLSQNIIGQLATLGMERAKFSVSITQKQNKDGALVFFLNGADIVEFLIATNPGEELKPLNKIASGGEISRIMLALKTISSQSDGIPTVIFDEIDTGISGKMASVVAQKLARISTSHQTICVTHTAQIAAMADVHNYIEKQTGEQSARTEVVLLDEQERYREISRLVGGIGISQFSDAHAKEIISWSQSFKESLSQG
jgi:DNA repair protein RecN (Recombination protein N)